MKLKLERNGIVESFDAIATIQVYEKDRKDVYNLLKFIDINGANIELLMEKVGGEHAELIVKGLLKYLKDNKLLDNENNITRKGRKVIDTETFPSEERGKFKFWLMEDPLVNKMLLHFQRERDSKKWNGNAQEMSAIGLEEKEYISVKDKTNYDIKIFDRHYGDVFSCLKYGDKSECTIEWNIDTEKEFKYDIYVSGELKNRQDRYPFTKKKLNINLNTDIHQMLVDIIILNNSQYTWDSRIDALKIDDINEYENKPEELINFATSIALPNVNTLYGAFNPTAIIDVPIMPSTWSVAKKWAEIYIDNTICSDYTSQNSFNDTLTELKERKELSDYKDGLNEINVNGFINRYKSEKIMDKYWHLQAPNDLNNELKAKYILDSLNIIHGGKYSILEIVENLIGDKKPSTMVFSSKYLKNKYQIAKFELFAKAFKDQGVDEIKLVTTEYIDLKDKSITIRTYNDVYQEKCYWPHDRYFAFKADNIWYYYKMTAELDQCIFDRDISPLQWTTDMVADWKDISFYRLEREVYPVGLLNYIDNI